ncbi:MAG: PspC domain-containing protein [Thermomicrobiales bacterium]
MNPENTYRRLYRSRRDRNVLGISGGMGAYFGVDPTLVRVGWVLATLATGPIAPITYLVLGLVIPNEPAETYYPI